MPSDLRGTLLFVTNFSDSSANALRWAIFEAKMHDLHLSVLYPYRLEEIRRHDGVVPSKKELDKLASKRFESKLELMLKEGQVSFDFHAEIGFIRDRVSEHSRRNKVAIVVMDGDMASAESCAQLIEEISVPLVIVPLRTS